MTDSLVDLQTRLREFARERDWEQFHTPKNLAMAVAAEAGELLEIFQWLSEAEVAELAEDPEHRGRIADEVADIGIYLLRLADVAGLDLGEAISAKIDRNASRYPAQDVAGRHDLRPVEMTD